MIYHHLQTGIKTVVHDDDDDDDGDNNNNNNNNNNLNMPNVFPLLWHRMYVHYIFFFRNSYISPGRRPL